MTSSFHPFIHSSSLSELDWSLFPGSTSPRLSAASAAFRLAASFFCFFTFRRFAAQGGRPARKGQWYYGAVQTINSRPFEPHQAHSIKRRENQGRNGYSGTMAVADMSLLGEAGPTVAGRPDFNNRVPRVRYRRVSV